MRIVVIGSGNVATHISLALKNVGMNVVQVFSKTEANAQLLATQLGCEATNSVSDIITDADVYLFSVKDDALMMMAEEVSSRIPGTLSPIFIHTAGSVPLSVFEGVAKRYAVLYPMQTFSKSRFVDFKKVPCFIEASDNETFAVVSSMAESITSRVQPCSSEKRRKMHLAAVFACNFTNHCYRLAEKVTQEEDIDFSLFLPLIEETARKVKEMSPKDAQTGPMVRYDVGVMERQISLIHDERTKQIYRLMADSIHNDR